VGIDRAEFLLRCARYVTNNVRYPSPGAGGDHERPGGAPVFPASRGPQTLNLQNCTISAVVSLMEARMNEELDTFLRTWKTCIELNSGHCMAKQVHLQDATVILLTRVYNALDKSFGDGDGILSRNDHSWKLLLEKQFVDGSGFSTTFTLQQFRFALVDVALRAPFAFSQIATFVSVNGAIQHLEAALDREVTRLLLDLAVTIQGNGGECPTLDVVSPGCCPLDKKPAHAEVCPDGHPRAGRLPSIAHSIAFSTRLLVELEALFDELDTDHDRLLGAHDFAHNPLMMQLWEQLKVLDTDQDGNISLEEFKTGVGNRVLSAHSLHFEESEFAAGLTLGVFAHTLGGRMDRIAYAIACELWKASGKSDGAAVSK
jgi:hypothetical protein